MTFVCPATRCKTVSSIVSATLVSSRYLARIGAGAKRTSAGAPVVWCTPYLDTESVTELFHVYVLDMEQFFPHPANYAKD